MSHRSEGESTIIHVAQTTQEELRDLPEDILSLAQREEPSDAGDRRSHLMTGDYSIEEDDI